MTDQTGPQPDEEPTPHQPPPPQPYGYGQPPPQQPPVYGQQPYGYGQMPYSAGPSGSPPPNYLVWAILSTVLCCLPLGVASIVFAAQVNNKWAMGDVAGAQVASRRARQFAIASAISAAVIGVLYLVIAVAVVSGNS
ncbi:MAG: CD225/dispanin family protein [Actinomycetales bacterium]|jgi:predicted secreted protein